MARLKTDARAADARSRTRSRVLAPSERAADCLADQPRPELAAAVPVGLFAADRRGRYTSVNPYWCALTGLTPKEAPGDGWAQAIHPADRAEVLAAWRRAVDAGAPFARELRLAGPDGRVRWVEATATPTRDAAGRVTGYAGAVVDVSARKATEERLALLARAGVSLASSLDTEVTLQRVARLAVTALADWCIVALVDGDGQVGRVAAAHADPALDAEVGRLADRSPLHADSEHPIQQAVRTGQARLHAGSWQALTIAANTDQADALRRLGGTAFMVVPLVARGRVIGAMLLARASTSRGYDRDELTVAEELAHCAATALDDARLYAAERAARAAAERASDRVAHLHAVTAALSGALTVDEIAEVVLGQGVAALGAQAGTVALLGPDGVAAEVVRATGDTPDRTDRRRRFAVDAPTPLATAIRSGRPLWLERAAARAVPAPDPDPDGEPVGALAAIPLVVDGRTVGALGLTFAEARSFDEQDRAFALTLAEECAQAIARAWLYEAEQRARAAAEQSAAQLRAIHDVTAPALADLGVDELLDESLSRLRAVLAADTAAVFLVDPSGEHIISRAAKGLEEEAASGLRIPLGKGAAGRIAAERRPIALEDISRVEVISPILREKGVQSLLGVPLLVEGKVTGVLQVGTLHRRRFTDEDIQLLQLVADRLGPAIERARLHEAERAARMTAERLAAERTAILAQIADGVVVADTSGQISFMNRVARELFGVAEGATAVTGLEAYAVDTADGAPYTWNERPLVRAAVHGEAVHGTIGRVRHADGREVVVEGSAVPILAEDGTRLGAVLTVRDVTTRQELERQKDAFFANASHDLRTPVATIKASVEVVLENEPPDLPEPLHRLLVNIEREADRMATLVDDLLDLARLEAGRLRLRPARCDLRVLAQRSARAVEPLLPQRGQRIALGLPRRPVMATVDAERIERALVNLLTNAHKYGPEGGTIRLDLERRSDELVFSVVDEGPGIPLVDQPRLFERFYRPKTEATRRSQGSGLGLPIAKAMVELHGGRIWVESQPGAGATFRIALPRGGRRELTG